VENGFERTYWANEVAELLKISPSALRKWSLRLEAEGYLFLRDDHDRRAYREGDLIALRKMQEFLSQKMNLENAAKATSTIYSPKVENDPGTSIVTADKERSDQRYFELEQRFEEYIQRQDEFHRAVFDRMDRRDQLLLQAMNEILETKKMIAAAAQEVQQKKKWYEFWKKG
jgi:DNA-binding transcriptional MerR regulator